METDYEGIKNNFANLSDASLDAKMIELIKNWSIPFKAIEILEVLDKSIHGALASGDIINIFQIMLNRALKNENITHDELIKQADWRKSE